LFFIVFLISIFYLLINVNFVHKNLYLIKILFLYYYLVFFFFIQVQIFLCPNPSYGMSLSIRIGLICNTNSGTETLPIQSKVQISLHLSTNPNKKPGTINYNLQKHKTGPENRTTCTCKTARHTDKTISQRRPVKIPQHINLRTTFTTVQDSTEPRTQTDRSNLPEHHAKQQSPSRTDHLNITNRPKHVTEPSQLIQKVKESQIFPFFFLDLNLKPCLFLETLDFRSKRIG